jgi:hypothetical protein
MEKHGVAESAPVRWTRAEDYFAGFGRGRSARQRRADARRPRTQPEAPRLLLSTLPFVALISVLGVLAVAIMIMAYPGSQPLPPPRPAAPQQHELGVAQPGWLEEAQKDFHK